MRLYELLSCLLTLPLIALLLLARPFLRGMRLAGILFLAALLAVLVMHLLREGAHWQMFPAYLAVLLLLALVFSGGCLQGAGLRMAGAACLLLVGLSVVSSLLVPMFQLPKPSRLYPVGTRILHLVDPSRKDEYGLLASGHRELMVQVWYPAQPSGQPLAVYRRRAETTLSSSYQSVLRTHSFLDAPVKVDRSPYPVLLFNPAWMGQRTQSTFLMEALASRGFVVVSIDHTYYSGKVEFPDGRVIDARFAPDIGNFAQSTVEEQDELGAKYVGIEADDDIFVLDEFQKMNQDPKSPFYQRLDTQHAGAMGHSLGGAAAAEACLRDPRILAALNMDGWMFGRAGREGLAKPLMLMYETRETTKLLVPPSASAPEAERRYWQMQQLDTSRMDATLKKNGGYRLYILDTTHWNFSDRPLYSPIRRWTDAGSILPLRGYEIINRYALSFFSHYLKGTPSKLLDMQPSSDAEADFRKWPKPEPHQ